MQVRFNFKEPFLSKDGVRNAFVEDQFHNQLIKDNSKIFRSISYEYLTNNENNICKLCFQNQFFKIMSIKIKTRRLTARKKETKDFRYINSKLEVFIERGIDRESLKCTKPKERSYQTCLKAS